MAYFLIEDFRGGLDVRRLDVAATPGTLRSLVDGHINRGGEIEARPAWIDEFDLPEGTHGLASSGGRVYVFGSAAITIPEAENNNLKPIYQRLQSPNDAEMTSVLSVTFFDGKPYVVAKYADGEVLHFYNGTIISAFLDTRSRATFTIASASTNNPQFAFAEIEFTNPGIGSRAGYTFPSGAVITQGGILKTLSVDGVNLIGNAMTVDNAGSAAQDRTKFLKSVVDRINQNVTSPNYRAYLVGGQSLIRIETQNVGTSGNGKVVTATYENPKDQTLIDFVLPPDAELSGGRARNMSTGSQPGEQASASVTITGGSGGARMDDIKINKVSIYAGSILWTDTDNPSSFARKLARAITDSRTDPNYYAINDGARVDIYHPDLSATPNGWTVTTVRKPNSAGQNIGATVSGPLAGGADPDEVRSITVAGVELLTRDVIYEDGEQIAREIAALINKGLTSPDYRAEANGRKLKIISTGTDELAANGRPLVLVTAGALRFTSPAALGDGRRETAVTSIKVNGREILGKPVIWTGGIPSFAEAIADQIDLFTSQPDYAGQSRANTFSVVSRTEDPGESVVVTTRANVTLDALTKDTVKFSTGPVIEPGNYVKTIREKVYQLDRSIVRFSKVKDPTAWNETTDTGAGFINMAMVDSAGESLVAMASYFGNVAVFSRRVVQVWFFDIDDAQNQLIQVVGQTGAIARNSVLEYGDNDVIYLSDSGIRSLRARNSSNAAFVNDIGTAIDPLITAEVRKSQVRASRAAAVIEPREGRYLLHLNGKIWVFSYFPANKISAWSTYSAPFTIDSFAVHNLTVLVRSGDKIYSLGGYGEPIYDDTPVSFETGFLPAGTPATRKRLTGIDLACEGKWEIDVALDPGRPDTFMDGGVVDGTTYPLGHVKLSGASTHFKFKITSQSGGYRRVSQLAIHYQETAEKN